MNPLKPKSTREILHESRTSHLPPITSVEELREVKLDIDDLTGDLVTLNRLWYMLQQHIGPMQFSIRIEDREFVFKRIEEVIICTAYPVTDASCFQAFNTDHAGKKVFMDYCNSLADTAKPVISPVVFDTEQASKALERGCYITCYIQTEPGKREMHVYISQGSVYVDDGSCREVANISNAIGCLTDFCNSGFILSVKYGVIVG